MVLLLAAVMAAACVRTSDRGTLPRVPGPPDSQTASGGVNRTDQRAKPHVVLVSLDGFKPEYIDRFALPNIRRIASRGVRAGAMTPVFPSLTFPNHYSLVTGLRPARHGIVSNTFYDPARGETYSLSNQATVRDGSWYRGEPIWVTAETQGMVAACFFWPGSEAAIAGVRPTFWNTYNAKVPNEERVRTVLQWLRLPDDRRPHVITLYFSEVDAASHDGPLDAPEVEKAARSLDRSLGVLVDGLDGLAIRDRVYVLVTSDHGMVETSRAQGIRLDALIDTAAIEQSIGGPVASLHVRGGTSSAVRVRDELNARLTHGRAYLREETPERFHYRSDPRAGDIVVIMEEPWTLVTSTLGAIARSVRERWGMHGWDPALASMKATFVAMGPGIEPGTVVAEVENIDVYPFMTELLGLRPPPGIDGRAGQLRRQLSERTSTSIQVPGTFSEKVPGTFSTGAFLTGVASPRVPGTFRKSARHLLGAWGAPFSRVAGIATEGRNVTVSKFTAAGVLALTAGAVAATQTPGTYTDLVRLFTEWRTFQQPKIIDGVPDYTARAMAAQHLELTRWRRRLNDLDPKAWPIPQQVDWHVVRAEMNGLDFNHRVLRPWANNPAFYQTVFGSQSDQPAREGPHAYGNVELWTYNFPLTPERAAQLEAGLRTIPGLLDQARKNLTGNGRDLWVRGAGSIREQSGLLERLATQVNGTPPSLAAAVTRAKDATDTFAAWVEKESATKKEPSGIGVANYDWYLKNVQLVPYTWRDEVTLMERELARAHAFLDLEERRNAALPPQTPIASLEEHKRRFDVAITEYMAFLRDRNLLTVRDYMEPALRARVGRFNPGAREFFAEVDYRDPEIMRTHGYHWFDLARMQHDPHPSPIRKGPLLYNLFITRTEGHATGWEEMTMQAGMLDARPRSRELVYVLLAQRAARALGDLKMHANELTLDEAAKFAAANTPRGWLRLDGRTVWFEQHLYLQQPAYGTSYVIGKIQIEELLAARRKQLGADFTLKRFMDEFDAAGLIPVSLLRWEMTGIRP